MSVKRQTKVGFQDDQDQLEYYSNSRDNNSLEDPQLQKPLFKEKQDPDDPSSSSSTSIWQRAKNNVSLQAVFNVLVLAAIAYLAFQQHSNTSSCNTCPTEFQDQTKTQLSEQSTQMKTLNQQSSTFSENLKTQGLMLTGMQGEFFAIRKDIIPLQEGNAQCTSCCQKMTDAQSTTQAEIQQVRTESNTQISQQSARVDQVQVQQGAQQGEIQAMKKDISEVKTGSVDVQKKDLAQHEVRIKQLEESSVSNQKAVAKTQENVFNQDSKIQSVQEEQAAMKKLQAQTDAKVDSLTATQNQQKTQLTTLTGDFNNLDQRVKKVEQQEDETRKCVEKATGNSCTQQQQPTYTQKPIALPYVWTGNARTGPNRIFDAPVVNVEYKTMATFKFDPMILTMQKTYPDMVKWRDDLTIFRVFSGVVQGKSKNQYTTEEISRKSVTQDEMKLGYVEDMMLNKGAYMFDFYMTCTAQNFDCGHYTFGGKVTFQPNATNTTDPNSSSNNPRVLLFKY